MKAALKRRQKDVGMEGMLNVIGLGRGVFTQAVSLDFKLNGAKYLRPRQRDFKGVVLNAHSVSVYLNYRSKG